MSEVLTGELLPTGTPLPTAATGGPADPVEELLREWLLEYGSWNTRDAYRRDVDHWLRFLAVSKVDPLTEARRVHTHAWLRAQELADAKPATRARRLAAVSAWYGWQIATDRTDRANPASIDRRSKPKAPRRSPTASLSRAQFDALLAAADADTGPQAARTAAIVALLLYTGLRVTEAVGADVDQLGENYGHRVLNVTAKGEEPHQVALPAPVTRRLDAYLAGRTDLASDRLPTQTPGARPRRPLFATASGGRLDRGAVWRLLKRLAEAAGIGIKMSPHVLRHTCATLSRSAGARLEDIQEQLGHADPRTTRRYQKGGAQLDRAPAYALASYLAAESATDSPESEAPPVAEAPSRGTEVEEGATLG